MLNLAPPRDSQIVWSMSVSRYLNSWLASRESCIKPPTVDGRTRTQIELR